MKRHISPLMVGRAAELRALAQAFEEAADGCQRTVLLSAEGGGGKTRLIGAACLAFGARARVVTGWCVDQGEPGLPFAPFVAIVRQLVRGLGVAGTVALAGREGARELGRLLPDLGPASSEADPGMARSRLFEAMRSLLDALARELPVVLVLEDLHWADRATRDLLVYLARNLQGTRLLLLVSYRSEAVGPAHGLRAALAELRRLDAVTGLVLPRLSQRDVAQQLAGMLGRAAPHEVVAEVHARGGGVPLFTEAMVAADGSVRTRLPGSLRDLLLGAANELPECTREVLRAMSLGGPRVGHRLLAAVAGTRLVADDPEAALRAEGGVEAAPRAGMGLEAALRTAVAHHLVVATDDAGYAFRHGLIREAIRDDLLPGERARLHRAHAQALDADPTLAEEAWAAGLRALHWRAAGDHARALASAWQAAGEAASRLAYAEQLGMLEHALALWDSVPPAARPPGVDRLGLLEAAADAACWAVEPARGSRFVEALLDELDPAVDGPRIGAMLLQRAVMRQQQMHPAELDDLQAALRHFEAPDARRAEALGQACRALWLHGRLEDGRSLAAELAMLAARLGLCEWQVEAEVVDALLRPPQDGEAISRLRQALDMARSSASGRLEMIVMTALVDRLDAHGDLAATVTAARSARQRACRLGQARYIGASVGHGLARALFAAGDWQAATEVIDDALGLDPSPLGRTQLSMVQGQIALARGDLALAQQCLDALHARDGAPQDEARRAAACAQMAIDLHLANGEAAAALAASRAVEVLRDRLQPHDLWPLLAAAWRACAESRPTDAWRRRLSESSAALPRAGALACAWAGTLAAEQATAGGRAAAAAWGDAAVQWQALGRPQPRAHALMRQGAAWMAAGDRAAATAALRDAAALAHALGAVPLAGRIAQLALRARIELQASGPGNATPSPLGLTPRELEVLKLLADGRSNREIASDLFIAAKTASVHVSNILAKLDVASRGAAAAAARRLGLVHGA